MVAKNFKIQINDTNLGILIVTLVYVVLPWHGNTNRYKQAFKIGFVLLAEKLDIRCSLPFTCNKLLTMLVLIDIKTSQKLKETVFSSNSSFIFRAIQRIKKNKTTTILCILGYIGRTKLNAITI